MPPRAEGSPPPRAGGPRPRGVVRFAALAPLTALLLAAGPVAGAPPAAAAAARGPSAPALGTSAPTPGASAPTPGAAAPAPGASGDWTAAPASGGSVPGRGGARSYVYLEGGPGAVLEDALTLTNHGDRPRTIRLRVTGPGRGSGAGPASGSWPALAAREVRLPPRTRAEVPFTVTVPADAAPGDHSGAVLASAGGHTTQVRLRLRVAGRPLAALSVEDVRVTDRDGGGAVIHYAVVNRGNTPLTPRLALRARGLFGERLHRAARALPVTLSPGQRARLTESWPDAPTLDPVDVRLTVTAPGAARATASARYTPVPGGVVALGAVAACGLAGMAVRFARRRRRRLRRRAGAVT
ncbi:hypothetical protein [Streptomyces sp. SAJ15]|uniref:COG1470 family protein n=1 Tax=Streptomyces sp. SAJ15 TaxID=2011095 RepID=UPI0011852992|nr:hypothetical protein [Streptomyces sp. SAJ15]TVL88177.1 hypothetical protein CD790_31570 [Streptomyces sp. SAJ15]